MPDETEPFKCKLPGQFGEVLFPHLGRLYGNELAQRFKGWWDDELKETVDPFPEFCRIPKLAKLSPEHRPLWCAILLMKAIDVAKQYFELSAEDTSRIVQGASREAASWGLKFSETCLADAQEFFRFVSRLPEPLHINRSKDMMLVYAFYIRGVLQLDLSDARLFELLTQCDSGVIDDTLANEFDAEPLELEPAGWNVCGSYLEDAFVFTTTRCRERGMSNLLAILQDLQDK